LLVLKVFNFTYLNLEISNNMPDEKSRHNGIDNLKNAKKAEN